MQALLKALALAVAALFLGGAVLTAVSERALAAAPVDAGVDGGSRMFFPASKAGPVRRPQARDAGAEALPGVKQQWERLRQQKEAP